ncbi:MAG: hypothetical protein ACHQ0J_15720 [Candidatus Dormibacterales bacterium]
MGSRSVRERRRGPKQSDQTTPNGNEHPGSQDDGQAADDGAEHGTNGSVQVATEHAAYDEAKPNTNGGVQVATEHAAYDEAKPNTDGGAQVGAEQAARDDAEPAVNGHAQFAREPAAHDEARPAANGHAQLADELEQATREGAQPSLAEERLPSEFSQSINDALTRRQTLPGFADPRLERINSIELPPWFIDRCRSAYLSVRFDPATECRVIGVTSAAYGEGKTSVAIGIATAMALDTKKPTLLIECDFAAPSFHKFFGIGEAGGLSDWLGGGSVEDRARGRARAKPVCDPFGQPAERAGPILLSAGRPKRVRGAQGDFWKCGH